MKLSEMTKMITAIAPESCHYIRTLQGKVCTAW